MGVITIISVIFCSWKKSFFSPSIVVTVSGGVISFLFRMTNRIVGKKIYNNIYLIVLNEVLIVKVKYACTTARFYPHGEFTIKQNQ